MNRYLVGPLVVLLVLLAGSVAYAAIIEGDGGDNTLLGSSSDDTIYGYAGADTIDATQGGADIVKGGKGADKIDAVDGVGDDDIQCQDGNADEAWFDTGDTTSNCETKHETPIPACNGVQVSPSQNLATIAANNPAGTTFCLADGTYILSSEVAVQSGDKFIGVYSDGSRPVVRSDGAISWSEGDGARVTGGSQQQNIFELGTATNTLMQGITARGGAHSNACEPDCGRGFAHGSGNNIFDDVQADYNENQGIGNCGEGSIIRNSLLTRNGNADSARDGGPVGAAGIKCGAGFSVESSSTSDNYWIGVWCDTACEWLVVEDSTTSDNGKAGISYEIADGTQQSSFARNVIKNNGRLPEANRRAGIVVNSSRNADISFNTFGGNTVAGDSPASYGVQIVEDDRPPVTDDIQVHNNTMNGDVLGGCGLSGVTCSNNT